MPGNIISPLIPAAYPTVCDTLTKSCLNDRLFIDTPAVPDHLNCAFAVGAAKQRASISKIDENSFFIIWNYKIELLITF
jgi:hypothetical protein